MNLFKGTLNVLRNMHSNKKKGAWPLLDVDMKHNRSIQLDLHTVV